MHPWSRATACVLFLVVCACSDPESGAKRGGEDTGGSGGSSGRDDAGVDSGPGDEPSGCDAITCGDNASCSGSGDSAACECDSGYEGDPDAGCTDIDECADASLNDCGDNATCTNTDGSFACECGALFGGADSETCEPLCDTALADADVCDPGGHGRCVVGKDGMAACTSCESGYLGDGKTCTADAECEALGCGANTVCAGDEGSRTCECAPGYEGDPDAGCTDVDECAAGDDDCDSHAECVNTPGGYLCDCNTGYENDGGACVNIDECATDTDDCAEGATCTDTDGSFECSCGSGLTGDGTDCYCDLSGYWGMRSAITTSWGPREAGSTVFVSAGSTDAVVWELHKYSYDGSTITVEKKGCGSSTAPQLCSPLYEEWYSSTVPTSVFDSLGLQSGVDVPVSKASPGDTFTTPSEAALVGLDLDDPLNDDWPPTRQDVGTGDWAGVTWTDDDNDGVDGVMLWPSQTTQTVTGVGAFDASDYCAGAESTTTYSYLPAGFESGTTNISERAACVTVATRVINHMDAEVETCEKITGDVINESAEGRVRDCRLAPMAGWYSADVTCAKSDWDALTACSDDNIDLLDGQDQTQTTTGTFELVKMGDLTDDVDCAMVRSMFP